MAQKLNWQDERSRLLTRICRHVQRRQAMGESVRQVLIRLAWFWSRRFYQSAPRKPVRLSVVTLYRAYANWQKQPASAAFTLHYKPGREGSTVPPALMAEFLQELIAPGVTTLLDGYRRIQAKRAPGAFPFSFSAFHRALTPPERKQFRALHRARRQAALREKAFAARVQTLSKRKRTSR